MNAQASDVFVYLIALRDGEKFKPPCKIGVSASPWGRLDALQTACPYELGIVGVLAYPSRDIALGMEDCFHSTQKRFRLRGEWFDLDPDKALSLLRLHARWAIEFLTNLSPEDKAFALELTEAHLSEQSA